MSDLDKLMNKLQDGKKKKEEPKPTPVEEEVEDDDDLEDEVEEVEEEEKPKPKKKAEEKTETSEPIPATVHDNHSVESEVALLNNNGIFRRELLMIEKEKTDVLKVIAQTLLDIRNKLIGEEDGE